MHSQPNQRHGNFLNWLFTRMTLIDNRRAAFSSRWAPNEIETILCIVIFQLSITPVSTTSLWRTPTILIDPSRLLLLLLRHCQETLCRRATETRRIYIRSLEAPRHSFNNLIDIGLWTSNLSHYLLQHANPPLQPTLFMNIALIRAAAAATVTRPDPTDTGSALKYNASDKISTSPQVARNEQA